MSEERWKPVVGWEDRYEVSSIGRVRRIKQCRGARAGALLTLIRHGAGYWHVTLCRPGEPQKKHLVHRLMTEAFLGPLDGHRMEVNHKNGDKSDNRLSNLERMSHAANMAHAAESGLMKRGAERSHAKLTAVEVLRIRELCSQGVRERKIAVEFGVCRQTVNDIKLRRRWAWLDGGAEE